MANAPDLSLRGAKRRGNLAVLCWISRKLRRKRNCFPEIAPQGHFLALRAQGATAPSGPRNDTSGSAAVHQCPPAVEWLCTRRSLTAATVKFGSACGQRWLVRAATASPRLPRRFAPRNDNLGECRGAPAPLHGLIPLYKALTARKGHAASVRRQSRQRLRRERRYRRNRSVRFYRHLARTGSAFPRLPRRFAPRNDTSGSAAVHQCPPAVEWLCTRRSLPARGTPHP